MRKLKILIISIVVIACVLFCATMVGCSSNAGDSTSTAESSTDAGKDSSSEDVSYLVTFDTNGSPYSVENQEIKKNQKVTKPSDLNDYEDSKGTYTFVGWFVGDTNIQWTFEKDVVVKDMVLKAHWEITEKNAQPV